MREGQTMPDYEAMYKKLFNAQTDAIRILQKAQRDTEEIYILTPEPDETGALKRD